MKMTMKEFYKALLKGDKLRDRRWGRDAYVYLNDNSSIVFQDGSDFKAEKDHIEEVDWEEFLEPVTTMEKIMINILSELERGNDIQEKILSLKCKNDGAGFGEINDLGMT